MHDDTLLGQVFALADYREQAHLLNVAGKTLYRVHDSVAYADLQLCRIADELDVHGRDLVTRLASFLEKAP